MRRLALGSLIVLLAMGGAACRSSQRVDPILQLSAEEALTQGKQLMQEERYARSRPYLLHAFEVSPNSPEGREALLLVADAYFRQGGAENYIQAESRYRDYLNRFPTSDQAAYAQLQIANSLAERVAPPDRDQTPTRQAVQAYEDVLRLYPSSPQAETAREGLQAVRTRLAEHEWMVGRFYYRFRMYAAAAKRFENLVNDYPGYAELDQVLFFLGRTYEVMQRSDDAQETYERLRTEHPDSQFVAQIPDRRTRVPASDGEQKG